MYWPEYDEIWYQNFLSRKIFFQRQIFLIQWELRKFGKSQSYSSERGPVPLVYWVSTGRL